MFVSVNVLKIGAVQLWFFEFYNYVIVNDDIKNNKEDILDYILKYHGDLIEERE